MENSGGIVSMGLWEVNQALWWLPRACFVFDTFS